jgi:hypothetical protein
MKWQTLRTYLELLSFFLWIMFTVFSISLAGLGIEGILVAGYVRGASTAQSLLFPVAMLGCGVLGIFLSKFWRQVGIDYFHYLQYDSPPHRQGEDGEPSSVLKELIREVESSAGYARNEARSKTKAWLVGHISSLDENDIQLAKAHFSYLLPPGWGSVIGGSLNEQT